jgi:hypothetical protein
MQKSVLIPVGGGGGHGELAARAGRGGSAVASAGSSVPAAPSTGDTPLADAAGTGSKCARGVAPLEPPLHATVSPTLARPAQ